MRLTTKDTKNTKKHPKRPCPTGCIHRVRARAFFHALLLLVFLVFLVFLVSLVVHIRSSG